MSVARTRYPWDERLAKCDLFESEKNMSYCQKKPDWPDWVQSTRRLGTLLHNTDDPGFALLERADGELEYSDRTFANGENEFDALYQAAVYESRWNPPFGHKIAKQWTEATGNHGFAVLLDAFAYYGEAWNARGQGSESSILPEAQLLFRTYLTKADEVLDTASPRMKKMGCWYALKLEIAAQHPDLRKNTSALFDEATTTWPTYQRLYKNAMVYAGPDWGGSYQGVERVAQYAVRMNPRTAAATYAQLYAEFAENSCCSLKYAEANWTLMKMGFRQSEALIKGRPDLWAKYANLACVERDREEARRLYEYYDRVVDKPDPNAERDACRLFATTKTSNKP